MKLVGRSSSHYTRVVRIVAHELGVALDLSPVFDLTQLDADCYGNNPALKIPMLLERSDAEPLFGTLNICRRLVELCREHRGSPTPNVIWPETLTSSLCRNANELVWHGMAAQVQWIFGVSTGKLDPQNVYFAKGKRGFEGSLRWLEEHLPGVLEEQPEPPRLSLFEVALFCLVEHMRWRETLPLEEYPRLVRFAAEFGQRESAQATVYAFDAPTS